MSIAEAQDIVNWATKNFTVVVTTAIIVGPILVAITWRIAVGTKEERIRLANERIAFLESASATPEGLKRIEESLTRMSDSLLPLTQALSVDKVTGILKFGGNRMASNLSKRLKEIEKHIEAGQWDEVLVSSERILQEFPLIGARYALFLYYLHKNYTTDAASEAEEIIGACGDQRKFTNVYTFLISHYRDNGRQKDADRLTRVMPKSIDGIAESNVEQFRRIFIEEERLAS